MCIIDVIRPQVAYMYFAHKRPFPIPLLYYLWAKRYILAIMIIVITNFFIAIISMCVCTCTIMIFLKASLSLTVTTAFHDM